MYRIKQKPEDFVVKELFAAPLEGGNFHYHILKKKNMNTEQAIEQIARSHHISRRLIGFAGNKDKRAVTEQVISIKGHRINEWSKGDLTVSYLGSATQPVSLGDNSGNHFVITVRNILTLPQIHEEFINYFGEQRFSQNNADIGKAIITRDFDMAAKLLAEQGHTAVRDFLAKHPSNPIGALQMLPKKLLKFMVHAYQSKLWNNIVRECIRKKVGVTRVPLLGFGSSVSGTLQSIVDSILREERITLRNFVVRALPYASSEGSSRLVRSTAHNIEVGLLEDDDLNEGQKKVTLAFDLDPGCYATEFIRQNFAQPA